MKPRQVLVKPPLLWNIAFQNTLQDPLKTITDASIELEAKPKVLAASVAGGYQYNDAPHMGPSVVVVSDGDIEVAETGSRLLSDMMWERTGGNTAGFAGCRSRGQGSYGVGPFPVALFDVGDNIGGGSTGDETTILAELLAQKARGWVVVLYDPAAVRLAKSAGDWRRVCNGGGGALRGCSERPVRVEGKVRSLHAGRYIETAVRHGGQRYWDMGHTAVIEVAGSTPDELTLLLSPSNGQAPTLCTNSSVAAFIPSVKRSWLRRDYRARAAYDPVAARIILVDTPGVTAVNPARFHFERARRDLWGMEN